MASVSSRKQHSFERPVTDRTSEALSQDGALGGRGAVIGQLELDRSLRYLALGVLIVAIALGGRLIALSGQPLGPVEAQRALSAWQLVQGATPERWDVPLAQSLAAVSIFLFGSSDLVVRALPVTFGVTSAIVVWPLRPLLGNLATAFASLLLAVSPLLVFTSRQLGPEAYAIPLSLLFVGVGYQWLESRSPRHQTLAACILGLLLTAGGSGYSFLILLALFVAGVAAAGLETWLAPLLAAVRLERQYVKSAALGLLTPIILVGTAGFLYPGGFGLSGIGSWLRYFDLQSTSSGISGLSLLVVYEPLTFLLALAGLVIAYHRLSPQRLKPARERTDHPDGAKLARVVGDGHRSDAGPIGGLVLGFLCFWTFGAFAFALLSGPAGVGQVAAFVAPASILSGLALASLSRRIDRRLLRREWIAPASLLLLTVFVVLVINHLTQPTRNFLSYQWTAVLLGLGLLISLGLHALQRHGRAIAPVLAACGLCVLGAYVVHSTSELNYGSSPELLTGAHASGGIVDFAYEAQRVEDWRRGEPVSIWVDLDLRNSFAWYLKDRNEVTFSYKPDPNATVLIASADFTIPKPEQYSSIRMRQWTSVNSFSSLSQAWRWLVFREAPEGESGSEIIMYVRS